MMIRGVKRLNFCGPVDLVDLYQTILEIGLDFQLCFKSILLKYGIIYSTFSMEKMVDLFFIIKNSFKNFEDCIWLKGLSLNHFICSLS